MLNVITLFSGYDSQCLALNRLGIPYDLVAWAEIDKHAKLAGNSIVVAYLYHIFRNLFVTTEPEAGTQTTLF